MKAFDQLGKLVPLVSWLIAATAIQLALPSAVLAVDCSRTPGGNVTISSSCTFPSTIDGADAGSGSSNTADIAVSGGATLTIGAGQTISTGTLTPSGGSIAVISGGQIKIGSPLWMYDADGDGYPKESTMAAQAAADPGWRRRNLMTSLTQRDCQDFSNSGYGCVPATNDLTNGTYSGAYQESAGNPAQSYRELPVDINTVGLWHMNEASGNLTDSSGNANTGTPTGTTVVAGKFGNGRSFNGTSDRVQFADTASLKLPLPYTIEFWLKSTSAAETVIISRTPHPDTWSWNYLITTNQAGGKLRFTTGSSGYNTNTDVFDGVWHHVAISINSQGALQWYIDGAAKESYTGAITDSGASIVCMGSYQTNSSTCSSTYFYDGLIDEMRISNVARTAEEIKANAQRKPSAVYTAPVNDLGQTPGSWSGMTVKGKGIRTGDGETLHSTNSLIAQWNFNETSGTTAAASAGSCGASCNGTLTNFASTASQDQAAGTGWTANNKRWGAGALMFDGSNDYVQVSSTNKVANSANSTVEAWVNWSGKISTTNTIYGEDQSDGVIYTLAIDTVGRPTFNIWVSGTWYTTLYSSTLEPGKWNHLVGTFSTTAGTKLYLNGINVKSSPSNTAQNVSTVTSVQLGRTTNGGGANYFQGILDSVRTYSRTLTAAEILANYQAGNVELQTRTSADNSTWEAWKPVTGETAIDAMDAATGWAWDGNSSDPTSVALDTTTKIEGTGSLKNILGMPEADVNTVGLWHLEEISGTGAYIQDATANNNDGTPTGTGVVDGFYGKGRSFNGTSEYVSVADANSLDVSKLTVETWFKRSTTGTSQGLVSKYNHPAGLFWMIINSSNQLQLSICDETNCGNNFMSQISTTTITDSNWHFAVGTWSGGTTNSSISLYLDGVLISSTGDTNGTFSTPGTDANLEIGRQYASANYFNGSIDEVRVSNTNRTAEEIAEAYRAGRDHRISKTISSSDLSLKSKVPFWVASDRPGTFMEATVGESAYANYEPDVNTIGLWHLEEQTGSGAYIRDTSSSGNNGTPTGTTNAGGKIGTARSFNGTSDYIKMSSSPTSSTTNWTMAAWVNPASLSQNAVIMGNGSAQNGYKMHIGQDGAASGKLWGLFDLVAWMDSGYTFSITDKWYYVVMTRDASTVRFYVDGVQTANTYANTPTAPGNYFTIGAKLNYGPSDPGWLFSGKIDEVSFSNTVRTADEIRQAFEYGRRTHPITIDFVSSPQAVYSSGTSVTINNPYGTTALTNTLSVGDTIIFKENVGGTETVSQAAVTAITNTSSVYGTVTLDAAPTFPTGGYSTNAKVFKWQREYMDLTGSLSTHRDAITRLTMRVTDGSAGANVWLDDFRSASYINRTTCDTLNATTGECTYLIPAESITSTLNRYAQIRAIMSTWDTAVSPIFTSSQIEYGL